MQTATEKYPNQMERDATWMSKDTWAARHGATNLNLWYDVQHTLAQNAKPWWDDSDKEGA
jgi:hypothetical protein